MSWFWGSGSSEAQPEAAPVEELTFRHFYLNMLVLNKEEVVNRMVQQKVAARLPRARNLQKLAGVVANRRMSDEQFLVTIGTKFAQNLPAKLAERGIIAAVAPRFVQQNLIVLEMKILNVDKDLLLQQGETPNQGRRIQQVLGTVRCVSTSLSNRLAGALDNKMLDKIDARLFEAIPQILTEKMEEKVGLRVEVVTKRDVDQAAWFFACLKTIGAPSSPAEVPPIAAEGEDDTAAAKET